MAELQKTEIQRVEGYHKKTDSDVVVTESEVLLMLNGRGYRSFYCLPTHLEEMARGHLITEGICGPFDIGSIGVRSRGEKFVIEATIQRHRVKLRENKSEVRIDIADVRRAVEGLNEYGVLFKKTGGTHVTGVFSGRNSVFVEDISRHCAIDKTIGLALQNGVDLARGTLVTSCRQTVSTIRKAIYSQVPIVISIAAVTSMSVEVARKYGITIIGFASDRSSNIYSHQGRVIGDG